MVITKQTPVADIAAALPSSIRVFEEHGVDFCCGGKEPIGHVCEEHGLSFPELVEAIELAAAAAAPAAHDWTREPVDALVAYIVGTYHDTLRADLPRLQALAEKVAQVHGAKAEHLARVEDIVEELAGDLIAHVDKEELVLFPAIRAAAGGDASAGSDVRLLVGAIEQEHDSAGALLAELRRVTNGYALPEWSCNTFAALYRGLAGLEADMHVHVHLENNVLFPRALGEVPLEA